MVPLEVEVRFIGFAAGLQNGGEVHVEGCSNHRAVVTVTVGIGRCRNAASRSPWRRELALDVDVRLCPQKAEVRRSLELSQLCYVDGWTWPDVSRPE